MLLDEILDVSIDMGTRAERATNELYEDYLLPYDSCQSAIDAIKSQLSMLVSGAKYLPMGLLLNTLIGVAALAQCNLPLMLKALHSICRLLEAVLLPIINTVLAAGSTLTRTPVTLCYQCRCIDMQSARVSAADNLAQSIEAITVTDGNVSPRQPRLY